MDANVESDDVPEAVAIESDGDAFHPYASAPVSQKQGPVPVTLITGYLGSGKTTLVRYILGQRHGYRIAVILNEYGGETGLESAFIQNQQGSQSNVPQWVELANGCLCCSVKAEFVQALEGLLQTGSRHEGNFDYILVETTGLANPGPIMSELWTDEELEAAVVLDGVVTVVDGKNIGRQLAERRAGGAPNEAQLQLALADVILLNKIDLLNADQAAEVQTLIRSINSFATVIPTQHSTVDLAQLLNREAYRMRNVEQQQQEGLAAAAAVQQPLRWLGAAAAAAASCGSSRSEQQGTVQGCCNVDHDHSDDCHGTSAAAAAAAAGSCQAHDHSVRTVSLRVSDPLDLGKFSSWVEDLIWDPTTATDHTNEASTAAAAANSVAAAASTQQRPEVLRMKGLLNIANSDVVHMFQAVYDLYDIVPGSKWSQQQQQQSDNGGPGPSRLVLIGRYLDQLQLQQQLEQCCALL